MDALSSKTISTLRLPLALLVVFAHSFGEPSEFRTLGEAMASGFTGMDFYNMVRIFCSRILSQVAVPAFFVISGYLFFAKTETYDWKFYRKQWTKRLHTLLIPYLLWNIIAVLGELVFNPSASAGDYLTLRVFWNISHWQDLPGGPVEHAPMIPALWFLRDLMVVLLLVPLLAWLIRATKGLVVIAILYLALMGVGPSILHCAVLFFSIGAYFSVNKLSFTTFFRKICIITLPLWIVLLPLSLYFYGTPGILGIVISKNMLMVGIFAIVGTTAELLSKREDNAGTQPFGLWRRMFSFASENTFFIYVAHTLFGIQGARFLTGLLCGFLPDSIALMTVLYLLTPFLAVGICLVVLYLARHFFPKITAVLLGER